MAWRSTRRFSRTRRKILIFTQVPQFAIAHCSECVFRAGATPDVTVARDLEVLAYHMLYRKPWIGRKYAVAPALRDCEAFALWKSETSREHHLECVDAPR